MIHNNLNFDEKIKLLIEGQTININPSEKKQIQKRLRLIKENCIICLSQLKDF